MQIRQSLGKWGNTTALRIPAKVGRALGLVPEREVVLSVEDDALVIRPAMAGVVLDDLLHDMTPESLLRPGA